MRSVCVVNRRAQTIYNYIKQLDSSTKKQGKKRFVILVREHLIKKSCCQTGCVLSFKSIALEVCSFHHIRRPHWSMRLQGLSISFFHYVKKNIDFLLNCYKNQTFLSLICKHRLQAKTLSDGLQSLQCKASPGLKAAVM